MTVAPTAGIAYPPADAPRSRITCGACRASADAGEPFCAHCGRRLAEPGKRGAVNLAATRSVQFALLTVLANAVVGGTSLAVVYLVSDAALLAQAALGLETMRWLLVAALATIAIRYGLRGLRETRDHAVRRRGWAVAGLVVSSTILGLATLSCLATAVLAVRSA